MRECKGDGIAEVGDGEGVGYEYMNGTRGSSIVSSTDAVLEVSVIRGMRGVSGVCEVCMCLARGGVGY